MITSIIKYVSMLLLISFNQWSSAAVILVGWDGADFRVVREMADSGQLPNLNRLTWGRMEIVSVTQTAPSWQEQLSGLPWYVTGCVSNYNCKPVEPGKSIFGWLKAHLKTSAFLTGKPWLPGTLSNIAESADIGGDINQTIEQFGDMCLSYARSHDFVFCHSRQPDNSGHKYGGTSEKYREKLLRLDVQLGRYIDEGHTILISSDHGFEQLMPVGYTNPDIPPRVFPFGFAHIRERNAIVGSNRPINVVGATELDVFKTLVDLLELPTAWWTLEQEGASLLIKGWFSRR